MADAESPLGRETAEARYQHLTASRQPFLDRARRVALVTIPALMPPSGHTGSTELPTPFQSVGADGVNGLAASMLLALFPPGTSFFRYDIDDFTLQKIKAKGQQSDEDAVAEFQTALGSRERAIVTRFEQNGSRKIAHESIKHLIATGNACFEIMPKGRMKFYPLDKYVCKRDKDGNVIDIITCEGLEPRTLPPQAKVIWERYNKTQTNQTADAQKSISLYTWVSLGENGKTFKVHQELCGEIIPGTEGTYPEEKCPWRVPRWTHVSGEDYGRGHGEESLGDLEALDSLSQTISEGSAISARVIFLLNEAGITTAEELTTAENGAVIPGQRKDVETLQVEKHADLSVASSWAEKLERRIGKRFLSVEPRDAERVTAEEIRLLAQELEKTLGGQYSLLAEELQRPIVVCLQSQLEREGVFKPLPRDIVSPTIIAGIEALGRTSDLNKLQTLLQGADQVFGQSVVAQYINPGSYFKRVGAALGINLDGLVRSDQEVQQMQQQASQQKMAEGMAPHLAGKAMDAAQQQGGEATPQ